MDSTTSVCKAFIKKNTFFSQMSSKRIKISEGLAEVYGAMLGDG